MSQTPTERRLVRTAAGFYKKAKQYNRPGNVTAADLARIYQQAEGSCYYCHTLLDLFYATFDHRLPFERGGDNSYDNVVLCCITDNRQKFTMTEAEYTDYLALQRRCRTCGKTFKPRAADYRRGFGWYCSRSCSGKVGGQSAK